MHDGMQYDPIQGQGHEPTNVGNSTIFKCYLLPHLSWGWQMTTDSYIMAQYLKLLWPGYFIFVLVFVSRELAVSRSRPSVLYGANFHFNLIFLIELFPSELV